jgi:tetratricopeptide (TPR) repeat protein
MTTDGILECPFCGGAVPQSVTICPSCLEDLSALIKLRSTHAIHYNEAITLAREGHYDLAQIRAELSISAKPEFAPAHLLLAKLLALQGEWEQASASAQRAAELMPDDERTRQVLEDILLGAEQSAAERAQITEQASETSVDDVPPAEPEAPPVDEETAPVQADISSTRAAAVQQLAIYERDVTRAFGLGAAVMGGLAFVASLLFRRKRD